MTDRYEVQARLRQSRNGLLVRDESRTSRADTLADARRLAGELVEQGFTVWVYAVAAGGVRPVYRSVQTLRPRRQT